MLTSLIQTLSRTTMCILLFAGITFGADPHAYVVNSVGESLSKINLTTGAVANNILTLGSDVSSAPNQLVLHGDRGYVTNSLTAEVQVIDIPAEATITFWPMPQGSNPYWLSIYDRQTAFVSLILNNSIARINLANGAIVSEDSIGISPQQMLVADHRLYVSNTALDYTTFAYGQGSVAVWDIGGDSLLASINVGTNPQQLALDNAGRIHVICTGNYFSQFGIVYVIDPGTLTVVDSLPVGGSPGGLVITPDNRGWVAAGGFAANGEVYAYDATSLTVQRDESNPISTGLGCTAIESWIDNSVMAVTFANTVEQIDQNFTPGAVYAVGSGPSSVAVNYRPGDLDGSWSTDLLDLTLLVDHLFISFAALPSPLSRGELSDDARVDIIDLTLMVDYLFITFTPLKAGTHWLK